ncbi:L-type lectin-domain containing receptor kinase [Seminavis robusta]|uniref:L-type lectin-domain containing receptor kinase n=1 Tax=Seminavis robusta TaxID=568900 RepID=A0A9N8ERP8_9STRA|nr:L-type lectin-domain containing receptor kinase [Seminavis robusta]|eukprot:Sro1691_g291460.1 L-type lectin-domain containing receptor kinase (364) ;mRNA; f:20224-21315
MDRNNDNHQEEEDYHRGRNLRRRRKMSAFKQARSHHESHYDDDVKSDVHHDDWYYDDPDCYGVGVATRFPTFVPAPTPTTAQPSCDTTSNPETSAPTAVSASGAPSVAPDINFRDGFPCDDPPFTLNRSPTNDPFPLYIPTTENPDLCFLRMSEDVGSGDLDQPGFSSTAFLDLTFDADNPNRVFSMNIGYRVYGADEGSADGMAFVIHQDSRGKSALGAGGGSMGIYAEDGTGIQPALVIEWDTAENSELLDIGENNIHAIVVDGSGTLTELAQTLNIPIRTDDAGATSGRMWVDYCDGQTLQVYLNNAGDVKPAAPSLEAPFDMNSIFSGQNFVTGYGVATGLEADFHDITSWELVESCAR